MWFESDEHPGTIWHHDGTSWTGWYQVDGELFFAPDLTVSHPPSTVPFVRKVTPSDELAVGDMVRHPTFGYGVVTDLSNSGRRLEVRVNFHNVGHKDLVAQYAKLEKVV